MDTTLVIMAAGIGSRFGTGIKQLTKMSDGNEIIMDYSIYDAKEAGFNKVVFIIRKDIEEEFKEVIGNRIGKQIDVAYAFQSLNDIPSGYRVSDTRKKPWGTGQAVLCAKDLLKNPFVVINADDYYGKEAFVLLHDFLVNHKEDKDVHQMAMAGFILKNTLSENGTVTRGVCVEDENHKLVELSETKNIMEKDGMVTGTYNGEDKELHLSDLCSMNIWAAYPEFLDTLEKGFYEFFENSKNLETDEFLLPIYIDQKVRSKEVQVSVLPTHDKWIGITYKEDIPLAKAQFKELVEKGVYPKRLWND